MNSFNANRSPLRWLAAVSALSLVFTAGQALADGSGAAHRSVKVSYADLDLSKQAGAEALYQRIRTAARTVCGRPSSREIVRLMLFRQCYGEAIDTAVKRIDISSLYAVHNRKSKAPATG